MTSVANMPSKFKEAEDDISRDYLEKTVGHHVSDLEFYSFVNDRSNNRGWTLPGKLYEGPGNSLHMGTPKDNTDRFAQIHDTQYFDTKFRYDEGEIDRATAEQEIFDEDQAAVRGFISNINEEPIGGALGAGGLLLKDAFEGIFGTNYPDFPEEPHKHMPMEWEQSPTKRTHSGKDQPHTSKQAKIANTPSKSGAVGPATLPEEVNLPEDADMGLTGTGKEQASGGASSEGTPMYKTIKPYSDFGQKTSTYTKCHKFMTFGLAPQILTLDGAGARCLTSALAEIPWHIPALYLNQSEYDLLPDGAHCVGLNIEVYYRGSTIQFETASTATGLATLNQINDIYYAHGLNRSGLGQNVRYDTFDATQPMLPTSTTYPTYDAVTGFYRGMVRDYYGSNNTATTFESDIPKHQIGRATFLYNYWVNTLRGGTATAATNQQYGGWPCLASAVEQLDGKTVVNQLITSSSYKPKLAPLKTPLKMYSHGLPWPVPNGVLSIPVGSNLVASRQVAVTLPATLPTSTVPISASAVESLNTVGNTNVGTNTDPTFSIYSPIEKCQMGRTGYWGNLEPHIQPSIHIGVQPVPALTTSATLLEDGAFNKWTDTRAYWEVKATMVVADKAPTSWPYASKANVPAGDNIVWQSTTSRPAAIVNPRQDGATFQGLYPVQYQTIDV